MSYGEEAAGEMASSSGVINEDRFVNRNQMQQRPNDEQYQDDMDYYDEDEGEGEEDSMLQSHIEANEGLERRLQQIKENIKKQKAETDMLSD